MPEVRGQADVVYGNNDVTEGFTGSTADFFTVSNLAKVSVGQTFTKSDVDSANHVVVIGPDLAKTLFGPNINPIDKIIRLKNVSFRVVGVLAKGGTGAFGVDIGNLVVMPITVAQTQLLGINYFNVIVVQANAKYDSTFVKSRVEFILEQNHGITNPNKDDFTIDTQARHFIFAWQHNFNLNSFLGSDCIYFTSGWRNRYYEYNVGVGYRTNTRDWFT